MVTYDDELRAHNERLRAAAAIRRGEEVLDIGCGAGQTTREAARAAAPGRVLGVDVSDLALERARELTAAEGLDNVTYEQADAEVHRFEPEPFDVAISRFGVMFFSDPIAAFANIARALRRRARVVLLVWQRRERNEWQVSIDDVLGVPPPSATGDPFSLGDPVITRTILEDAGFDAVRFADVHEPMFFGGDVSEALEWVRGSNPCATHLPASIPAPTSTPWTACVRRSPRTTAPIAAWSSTRARGSSPPVVAESAHDRTGQEGNDVTLSDLRGLYLEADAKGR